MIEQRFGSATSTAVLAMMLVTLVVFCLSTIWNLGIKTAYETVSAALQGNPITLPENFLAISISALVLGVVPVIGAFLAARLFISNVESHLALAGYQRASLELRYTPEPPYRVAGGQEHRIGVYNRGPSTALDAQVRLLRAVPTEAIPDDMLPRTFQWQEDWRAKTKSIAPGQEAHAVLFQSAWLNSEAGPIPGISILFTDMHHSIGFEEGEECRLHLQATALNTDPIAAELTLRREGEQIALLRVDVPGSAGRK